MLVKQLGNSPVRIPEIGIGTWGYHGGPQPLRSGLDAGALFIDTAESYGSEPVLAEAIAGRREQVFLATKVSPDHFRRADLLKAADHSLSRLHTDHIDLYQLHRPNETIPIEETLGAMEDLVDAGKVRFIGVSNFSLPQLKRAQKAMRKHSIVANQIRFNLIDRTHDQGLLSYCQAHQITVIAYSPLARGFQNILDCDPTGVLKQLEGSTGRTAVQIALNWCLCRENVVIIPKGNSVDHVLENCGASDWRLTPEQIRDLDDSILFRRRGNLDSLFRRYIPPLLIPALKSLRRFLPGALRRRIT